VGDGLEVPTALAAVTLVGATGAIGVGVGVGVGEVGVTAVEAVEASEVPIALVAVTVNV